jgi:anaerobic magnesium-protoporphyrin IX monomethyl ester cyclase
VSDITLVNLVFPTEVRVPPHGQLYLLAALEQAGYAVELRDYQLCELAEPWEPETVVRFAADSAPIIGFGCMSYALPLLIEASARIKRADPGKVIIAGGIGPSAVAERLLRAAPSLDAIVIGEGERTIVEVMDRLKAGRDLAGVAGVAYRDAAGAIRVNPTRDRIPTLDQLPLPSYHRVDFSRYRLVDIQYGRGCPYDCTFCDIAPYWGRKHTRRPVRHFIDELELLVERYGRRDVFVIDDTFVLSRAHVLEICDEILRRRLDVKWGCYARVDLMDEGLMERMAAAGCTKVFYGIEAGSDSLLRVIEKRVTKTQNQETVRRSLNYFPYVTTSFVWGFPHETVDDLEQTVYLLLLFASLGASPQINLALPYSYSQLFRTHRTKLTFEPEYASQLHFYQNRDRGWLYDRIKSDPELFSVFYRLPTPDLEQKWQLLDEFGLDPLQMQKSYFDHPEPTPS